MAGRLHLFPWPRNLTICSSCIVTEIRHGTGRSSYLLPFASSTSIDGSGNITQNKLRPAFTTLKYLRGAGSPRSLQVTQHLGKSGRGSSWEGASTRWQCTWQLYYTGRKPIHPRGINAVTGLPSTGAAGKAPSPQPANVWDYLSSISGRWAAGAALSSHRWVAVTLVCHPPQAG